MSSSKTTKLVLRPHRKLNKLYHSDTGLVFKSATEKVVIGRIVDDEFVSLDEEALDLCQQNNFRYDESLVEMQEETPDVDEEETPEPEPPVKASKESKVSKKKNKTLSKEIQEDENKSEDQVDCKDFTTLISSYNKDLQDCVARMHQTYKDKVTNLEKQLTTLKKELEDSRKKLKNILCAMQDDL